MILVASFLVTPSPIPAVLAHVAETLDSPGRKRKRKALPGAEEIERRRVDAQERSGR